MMIRPMTKPIARPALPVRTQRLLLVVASVTVLTEVASLLNLLPGIPVGRYELSASVVPALLLVPVLGSRLFGKTYDVHAEVVFWAAASIALFAVAIQFIKLGDWLTVPAIFGAALDEELVYRLAVPLVISAALVGWGVRAHRARVIGFVIAGLWFVSLPGHRMQMGSLAEALPFLGFATLAALVVYRSGSVFALVAVHACTDFFNILAIQHHIGPTARALGLAALFTLLVMSYGAPRPRPRSLRGVPTEPEHEPVIDLRDHVVEPQEQPEPASGEPGSEDEHLPVG